MRSAGIDFLTVGQYLQPTPRHAKVADFVTPATFNAYASIARAKGFLLVSASPLTRSSYHAGEVFARLKARSEAHTSELQSLMRSSYAVLCLKKKNQDRSITHLTV